MTEALLQRHEGALRVLSMNRPERRNALNAPMLEGLVNALRAAADDARSIQPDHSVWPVSALHAQGIEPWCEYLDQLRRKLPGFHVEAVETSS